MAPADAPPEPSSELRRTALHARHLALGARMTPFAGYDMPVQYPTGVLGEHLWTRQSAGLFDVSHMGQAFLAGADVAARLETLVPADIAGLAEGRIRYTQLLNADGGILDDLMVTRVAPDRLYLVVNAANKHADFALLRAAFPTGALSVLDDRALIALQGPKAIDALADALPQAATTLRAMPFMSWREIAGPAGAALYVSRSGYTGEDGFEISVPDAQVENLVDVLLGDARVKPIGLGARDSLRLEAGLCLHGHDIDATTSPIEAALNWSIQKRRRAEGGFPGAARIQRELAQGPARLRVGLALEGRQPAREGAQIATRDGAIVGRVTSGGFSPTRENAIAMGYVDAASAHLDTPLDIIVRGKPLPARVIAMPFVPHRYAR